MKQKYFLRCKLWLAGVFFLWTVSAAQAQNASCPNLDFSFRNFQNWVCQTANSLNIKNTAYSALTWTGDTAIPGRHTIMTDIHGVDSNTCDSVPNVRLALVPDGFIQSARIGNSRNGGDAECIKYTMTVDSSNALFFLHFAVVMEDPLHYEAIQPRFGMRIQDTSGNLLTKCPGNWYEVLPETGIFGFNSCGTYIRWCDWTTLGVNLLPLCGQKIQIVLYATDCGTGGHFGYAYVVGECQPMSIEVQFCAQSTVARLTAPKGFLRYSWYDDRGNLVDTNQRYNAQDPPDGTVYTCRLYSANGIVSTLSTVIQKTRIDPEFGWKFDTCKQTVYLEQRAYTNGSSVSSWTWEIGKEGASTEFMSNDSILNYKFKDTGMYKITLTVNTRNGCTDTMGIYVRSSLNKERVIPAFDCVIDTCARKMSLSLDAETMDPDISSWSWTIGKNDVTEYSGNDTAVKYVFKDTGVYEIRLTVQMKNGCVLDTVFSVSNRYVTPEITVAELDPEYCDRQDGHILVTVPGDTDSFEYSWQPVEVDTNAPEIQNLKAGKYTVMVFDGTCMVSKEIVVDAVPGPQADFTLSADSVAENERFILSESAVSNGAPLTAWVWNFGDGISDTGRVVTHSYSREGTYAISLTVMDNNRCFGSTDKHMRVYHVSGVSVEDYDEEGTYRMYIPNAFTPNGDGLNDGWGPSLQEYLDEDYFLSVYDSQGRLVWHSSNPSARWDGTVSGRPVRGGSTFAYRLRVRDYTGKLHEYAGHVIVVK